MVPAGPFLLGNRTETHMALTTPIGVALVHLYAPVRDDASAITTVAVFVLARRHSFKCACHLLFRNAHTIGRLARLHIWLQDRASGVREESKSFSILYVLVNVPAYDCGQCFPGYTHLLI